MPLRLQGLLLFLFIPLVLFLFLRQPLGPAWSIGCGLALMFGHRHAAGPWARRHAGERCAWCGAVSNLFVQRLEVVSGGSVWSVAACSEQHASSTARFLSFVRRWRAAIALGIFVPLVLLLAAGVATAAGQPFLSRDVAALQFRVVVAFTVVAVSLAYVTATNRDDKLRSVFPFHNLLLLGTGHTLWIFRLVGAWWLIDGLWRWWSTRGAGG